MTGQDPNHGLELKVSRPPPGASSQGGNARRSPPVTENTQNTHFTHILVIRIDVVRFHAYSYPPEEDPMIPTPSRPTATASETSPPEAARRGPGKAAAAATLKTPLALADARKDARKVMDLSADVHALAEAAIGAPHVEELLMSALDWIGRVAPYDLACVFELREAGVHDTLLQVRVARGKLVSPRILSHTLALKDFPSLQETLRSGRARAFTSHDHSFGDGDPFDGVLDLPPGHSCMVVPLVSAGRAVGLLTLDRQECVLFPEEIVRLIEVCCQLISLAVENARNRELLDRLQLQQASVLETLQHEQLPDDALDTYSHSEVPEVRVLLERLQHIAVLTAPVLISGETGVGKEVFARLLHAASPRRRQPFVKVNCASLPENLFESELFGHVKGAFTGASMDRPGRFRTANGGTLFLDEIGDAPLAMQAKLLRVLQEGEFEPVGSDRTVKVDVRIIAATNVDLARAIAEKTFRADLYYRLSVFPIILPPLRQRVADLPRLCKGLLVRAHARNGRGPLEISPDGLELLRRYPWPGNVRELANVLERASYLLGTTRVLTAWHLEAALGPFESAPSLWRSDGRSGIEARGGSPGEGTDSHSVRPQIPDTPETADARRAPSSPAGHTLEALQRTEILRVLRETRGRVYGDRGAAVRLGLKPSTLQARMKKLGIDRLEAAIGVH